VDHVSCPRSRSWKITVLQRQDWLEASCWVSIKGEEKPRARGGGGGTKNQRRKTQKTEEEKQGGFEGETEEKLKLNLDEKNRTRGEKNRTRGENWSKTQRKKPENRGRQSTN
jgi:hypothetical protein